MANGEPSDRGSEQQEEEEEDGTGEVAEGKVAMLVDRVIEINVRVEWRVQWSGKALLGTSILWESGGWWWHRRR